MIDEEQRIASDNREFAPSEGDEPHDFEMSAMPKASWTHT